ncbi:MAG: hypothetical protein ACI9FR_000446 [Cryomorphaceae bacterium]|jgi:hypothetical protein
MSGESVLILAACLNALAALLHVGCILFGATWYRFFGAGEELARLAEQGSLKPTLVTSIIVIVLASWAAYLLSAAGMIGPLPFFEIGLLVITGVYLIRGVGGFFFITKPMGRSKWFWFWSSAICLASGLIHLYGTLQYWRG